MKNFGFKEAVLAGALAMAGPSLESGCGDNAPDATTEAVEEKVFETRNGDWLFTVKATAEFSLAGAKEKTFYHWLSGKMKEDPVFVELAKADKAVFIDGLIALSRILNPDLNLDDFSSVAAEGVSLVFPIKVLAEPRPERIFSIKEGGYSRLQELAIADRFPVDRVDRQQETFNKALVAGQKIPTSPWFYLDRKGSEDSPAVLAPDVIERLEDFGRAFSKLSFGGKTGWRVCLTDIMRDPVAQAKRNEMKGSTHTTGRSFDISSGRFLTPEGKIVTWSVFDSEGEPTGERSIYAKMIDEEMQPAIERLIGQYGLVPFKEGGHWHIYAPKDREIDLSEELMATVEVKTVELSDAEKELSIWKRIKKIFGDEEEEEKEKTIEAPPVKSGCPEIVEKLNIAFAADQERITKERLSSAEVDARFATIRPTVEGFLKEHFPNKSIQRPFLKVLEFGDESELGRQAKDQVIELIRTMPPKDLERLDILKGLAVHGAEVKTVSGKKENPPPFFELRRVWQWKVDKRLTDGREYAQAILRLDLESLNHSVDITSWREKQIASIELLRRHGEKFGFRREITEYLTPEIMLAVIHAEFFSELDSRSFVSLAPALFEPYNLVFGPALNDNFCSAGPVQLIQSTFVGLLDNEHKRLQTIKTAEGEKAGFSIPVKIGQQTIRRRGKEITYGVYEPNSFAQALVGDADSIIFYGTLTVLDHTEPAFDKLFSDQRFVTIWNSSSGEEKELFFGTLAPLAINGGGRRGRDAARVMIKDGSLTTLTAMAKSLIEENIKKEDNAERGARVGFNTTKYFIERVGKD